MKLVALVPVVALLIPVTPAVAREPEGLAVTGWALDGATPALVARNADGLSTVSVAGVSISAAGTGVSQPNAGARRLARAAHHHGLAAELLVGNYSNRLGDFDPRARRTGCSPARRGSARWRGGWRRTSPRAAGTA